MNGRRIATVAALVGVNIVGVSGQAMWAYGALGHSVALALGFAAVLESVALYLASEASAAMLANDRAGTLRLAAYAFGLLTGGMNYLAHATPGTHTATPMAVAFGVLSAMSPWLWTIHSRRTHRDQLAASGLIDPRAVKVPLAMWGLYPRNAFALLRLGVLTGTNNLPTLRQMLAQRRAVAKLAPADAIVYAAGEVGYDSHAIRVWLSERGRLVDGATLATVLGDRPRSPLAAAPVSPAPGRYDSPADLHRSTLRSLSNRDRIRYAYATLGNRSQSAARTFLAELGYTPARSEFGAVAKESGGALAGPSGAYPVVPAPREIAS